MSNPALDQTTLEESFFFSEYAKRRFEMSKFNDGQINGAIDNLNYRSSAIFCDDVPKSFDIDLLTESQEFATKSVGRVRNLNFEVLREGWN